MTLRNAFEDMATEATLDLVLTELGQKLEAADLAALSTAAKQDAAKAVLDSILTSVDGLEGFTDGIEGSLATLNAKDFATQTTLAAVLTKLSADPATQTTLAAVLAAINTAETNRNADDDALRSTVLTDAQLRAAAVAISAASLPLPTGAATETTVAAVNAGVGATTDAEAAGNGSLIALLKRLRTLLNGGLPAALSANAALKVEQVVAGPTQPVSAASLPLPTGATQDATLTGGTQKAQVRGGAKGTTTAADVTSTAEGTDHQALDTQNYHGGVAIDPRDVSDRAARLLGVVRPGDASGGYQNRAYGPWKVSVEEHTLFLDTHDQALDTTNRWTAPTGTNAPAVSSSVLTFGVATTASAFGKLPSQPTFSPQIPGFLQPSFFLKVDPAGAAALNGHRFWGIGTSPATPATTSASTKLTDAIGFEIDTDGKLRAVVYAAGVRTSAVDLSATGTGSQPLDGSYHRYLVQIRTDQIHFFIDTLSAPVATISGIASSPISPSTQTLPILFQTINPAASVAAGGYPLTIQGTVVADTASNGSQLSDGTYPWRKATVSAAGRLSVDASGVTVPVDTELPPAAALADATANPTVPTVGAAGLQYNGATWELVRGNFNTTTGDTGTKTASFTGATQTNFNAVGAIILVKLGTVSGVTPTLSCQLQWSYDGGTTWLNIGTALANLTASNATGAYIVYPSNTSQAAGTTPVTMTTGATVTTALNLSLPRVWRLNFTIGGTTPSFAVTAVYVNYIL